MTVPERQGSQLQHVKPHAQRPERTVLNPFQQRLIARFSSLLLALAQIILIHVTFAQIPSFWGALVQVTIGLVLLYFVVPIPLSAYISYQTHKLSAGRHEGGKVGCSGAILSLFFMLAYIYIYTLLYAHFGSLAVPIYLVGVLVTCLGVFSAQLGALVGSLIGMSRKK